MVDFEIDPEKIWSEEDRQAYIDGLPEMSLFEDHIIPGDPMVDAMQALIEEGETTQTLALHWKKKGNQMFSDGKTKNKMYFKNAIQYYDDALAHGLDAMKNPPEELDDTIDTVQLVSTILSNRAAVHLEIKNYRSCRSDCARAIWYWKGNVKAYFRGASASLKLSKPEDVIMYCVKGLSVTPDSKILKKLITQGKLMHIKVMEAEKKSEKLQKQKEFKTMAFKNVCMQSGIRMGYPVVNDQRVLDSLGKVGVEDNQHYWPMLVLYSQHGTSDFIQAMGENDMFIEHLANMFPEEGPFCDWDTDHEYVASKLSIYAPANIVPAFEHDQDWHVAFTGTEESDTNLELREKRQNALDAKSTMYIKVQPFSKLTQLLQHPQYVVPGVSIMNVFVSGSEHERRFTSQVQLI